MKGKVIILMALLAILLVAGCTQDKFQKVSTEFSSSQASQIGADKVTNEVYQSGRYSYNVKIVEFSTASKAVEFMTYVNSQARDSNGASEVKENLKGNLILVFDEKLGTKEKPFTTKGYLWVSSTKAIMVGQVNSDTFIENQENLDLLRELTGRFLDTYPVTN